MLNQVPYTYKKRGIFYYNRMVPSDLDDHYESRRVNFSLRTKSTPVQDLPSKQYLQS